MWKFKNAEYADHIRVYRGLYYHHGIYANDNCVYHFAAPEGSEISEENAIVCVTTLEQFLNGGLLEVREYSEEELQSKKAPDEIIEYAKAHLGETGYNLISNNCEHFANRCVMGKSESNQVQDIFNFIMGVLNK